MKYFLAAIIGALALAYAGVVAQPSEDRAKRSDAILRKAAQLNLLNQLLPLLLTKAQIDALLPAIEKARSAVRRIEQQEFELLAKLEPKLDAEIKAGIDKKQLPAQEVLRNVAITFKAFSISRSAVGAENVDGVLSVFKAKLDKGQQAAAINALDASFLGPDPSKITDDQKLRLYISSILLDPQAYDLLLKLRTVA